MGNAESNESAAVKRQAEGFSNPMYRLLDLGVSDSHDIELSQIRPTPAGWRVALRPL